MHHYSEAVEEREDLPEKSVRHVLFAELMKRSGEMNMSLVRDYLWQLYPDYDEYELVEQLRASFEEMRLRTLKLRSIRRKRHIRQAQTLMMFVFFLVAITGIGFAFGINIWQVAYQWTTEHLFMNIEVASDAVYDDGVSSHDSYEYVADTWGAEVHDLLVENNLYPALPTWIPERFEFESCEVIDFNSMNAVAITYSTENEENLIVYIQVLSQIRVESEYYDYQEISQEYKSIVNIGDVDYYIMDNLKNNKVYWIDNGVSVTISGIITTDEILSMIESIN